MDNALHRDVHCILGLPFDAVDEAGALRIIRHSIQTRQQCFLSTPNLNWIVASLTDNALRRSVLNSDLSIADGMPIIWTANLLGIPLPERVAGSSLLEALQRDRDNPTLVYFFGGPEGIAEKACARINSESGGLRCVGFECPGFGTVESMSSDSSIDKINASGADFLVVSLGAKKGQAWIEHNRARITVPVISHLGAVVNFFAGSVNRAPNWMQRTGLEWLWRIKEEPGLWRRYFFDGITFSKLLLVKVIPLALINLRYTHSDKNYSLAEHLTSAVSNSQHSIQFSGALTKNNLDQIQSLHSPALEKVREIFINAKNATFIDSAFLGHLMLASNKLDVADRQLKIIGTKTLVRKIMRYACVENTLMKN